jgi:hypothetical protein
MENQLTTRDARRLTTPRGVSNRRTPTVKFKNSDDQSDGKNLNDPQTGSVIFAAIEKAVAPLISRTDTSSDKTSK